MYTVLQYTTTVDKGDKCIYMYTVLLYTTTVDKGDKCIYMYCTSVHYPSKQGR